MSAREQSLTGRTIVAAKWSYAGNMARSLAQFAIGIWLARILGPTAFGIVAIAWLMIGAGKLVADFGFGAALVQREVLTSSDIQFALTVQILIGLCLSGAGAIAAPWIAGYFHTQEATPVIRVMALLFMPQAIGQTGTSLLSRTLQFKAIQVANITSYLVGYLLIGIPCAVLGLGVWSLVAAQATQVVGYAVVVAWISHMKFRPVFRPDASGMFLFGSKVIGANVASWAILNVDSLVVGRAFGTSNLGLYNRAMTLVATPVAIVTGSLQGVLFSACARSQTNMARIREAYLGATGLLALVTLPVFSTLAVIPKTAIMAVYGDGWVGSVPILAPLALAMPMHSVLAIVGPVLMGINRTGQEVRAQWLTFLLMIPLFGAASLHSLAALAWAVPVVYLVRLMLLVDGLRRAIEFRWINWCAAILPGFLASVVVAVPVYLMDASMQTIKPFTRLLIDGAVAAGLLVFALQLVRPLIGSSPLGAILRMQAPGLVSRWIGTA